MRKNRALLFGILVLCLFGLVLAGLACVMLVQGEELAAEAAEQQTRSLEYYQYGRGDILDRQGRQLTNVAENCLVVFPAMVEDEGLLAEGLAQILQIPREKLLARLSSPAEHSPYVLKTGLSGAEAQAVLEAELPGVSCLQLAARYSDSHPAVHLIGSCQKNGALWQGVSGLELQYENYLQGRRGRQLLAYVDAEGKLSLEEFYLQEAETAANQLQLTLDLDYQQIAENAFRSLGYSGACVILNPENGDILAAASVEGFDPYSWEDAGKDAYVNKALALYHPASSFKTLLAAAALSEGIPLPEDVPVSVEGENAGENLPEPAGEQKEEASGVDSPDTSPDSPEEGRFLCTGEYAFAEGHQVACTAAAEGHGPVNLSEALARSCNCYFVALGQRLSGELIQEYCEKLGLCEQKIIGYDLLGSSAGDYLDFSSEIPGDIANLSLGERGVMLSPLQEAVFYAAIANGGYRVMPRLVQQVRDENGKVLLEKESVEPERVLDAGVAAQLREMLVLGVEQGTAQGLAAAPLSAGAKTGTSESGGVWCSGFSPAEQPRWVIVVHVDQGQAGGIEAAAVFRRILEGLHQLGGA